MHHPVQMKPADTDQKNEDRKLFVGMLSKSMGDDDVRNLFENKQYIDECRVLRNGDGHSRGCAFVTYNSRQEAFNAIKAMHQSITLDVSIRK